MGIETAIVGSAILGAGTSLLGAKKSSDAAKTAAQAQSDAAQKQVDLSREIYYDQRGLQQPYYQAGLQGMYGNAGLMNLLGHTTPGGTSGAPQTQTPATNVFATGQYGATPGQGASQSGPDYASYVTGNKGLNAAYTGLTPEMVRGIKTLGYDANNDGQISADEYGKFHYQKHGQAEGRELPQFQPQNVFAQGTGQQGTAQPANVTDQSQATPTSDVGPMTETLRQTPGYQFLQDEATRSVENSFASRGKLMSGAAMTALQDRAMGLADNTYQQAVNNNFNLANLGMGSAAQIQSAGNVFANNANTAYGNMGNATANGALNQASAWNAGAQGVVDSAMGGLGAWGAYKGWGS